MAGVDEVIVGLEQLQTLSKALKRAGHKNMRNKLHTRMKPPVRALIPDTRAEALRVLPKSGGLGRKVSKLPQRVQVATGSNPGVRLVVGKNKAAARALNRGPTFRHPVFAEGDRKSWTWVAQPVRTTDWFDRPARRGLPKVQDAVLAALEEVADEIVKELS